MATAAGVTGTVIPDDPVAFGAWVRPYCGPIAHLISRLAPHAERDDLVQEVLLRAWKKRSLYDPARGTPSTWLLAIAADQAAKSRRRWRFHASIDDHPQAATADPPSAGHLDIARALPRLSRRQRLAVECHYYVGLTVAETAAVMGCSPGTVKSTLADARARLRTLLEVIE